MDERREGQVGGKAANIDLVTWGKDERVLLTRTEGELSVGVIILPGVEEMGAIVGFEQPVNIGLTGGELPIFGIGPLPIDEAVEYAAGYVRQWIGPGNARVNRFEKDAGIGESQHKDDDGGSVDLAEAMRRNEALERIRDRGVSLPIRELLELLGIEPNF